MKPVPCAEDGDDDAEHRRLDESARDVVRHSKDMDGVREGIGGDARILRGDEPAAEDADDIAEDRQERHHAHARDHARHDEVADGTRRHDAQGVDLLRDLHRADLRRDGRPHAPCANDTDEHGAKLTPDGDGYDASDRRLRAEADELMRDLQRHDHTSEEHRQGDNGE